MKKIIICSQCQAINRVEKERLQENPVCGKCSQALQVNPRVESLDQAKLQKVIQHAELPVVIDAYADWCGPCKMYGPIFEEVAKEKWQNAEFYKLNTEVNQEFSMQFQIRGIPTTLVFFKGKLVQNQSGLLSKEQLSSLLQRL